jgi:thiosulfate/3-mercaptopyruvate sulfurtransferase
MHTTLVDTATLADHLTARHDFHHGRPGDPAWIVIDCRFRLDDTAWGAREYAASHVSGAAYAHLDHDLSGAKTGTNGRHPLPDVDVFRQFAGGLGIGPGVQVVAYDQDNGMFASRLWWLLRWIGHSAVAVLDGGFAKWQRESRPTSTDAAQAVHTMNIAAARSPHVDDGLIAPRAELVVTADEVAAHMNDPDWRLLDARAPERYRGETEPLDRLPGHIPGAANHFFKLNVDDQGVFLPREELRANLLAAIDNTPTDRVVCYCGSGVTACHNVLALEHAGLHGAKLYPGSWSEWVSDPDRPIERG